MIDEITKNTLERLEKVEKDSKFALLLIEELLNHAIKHQHCVDSSDKFKRLYLEAQERIQNNYITLSKYRNEISILRQKLVKYEGDKSTPYSGCL